MHANRLLSLICMVSLISPAYAAATGIDWGDALKKFLTGVQDANKDTPVKQTIAYSSDQQLTTDVVASLKARMVKIRVEGSGLDTKDIPPAFALFAKAIHETKGVVQKCDLQAKQDFGLTLGTILIPMLIQGGVDVITQQMQQAHIPELVKNYHMFFYVQNDKRTLEYLLFQKRDLGKTCPPPVLKTTTKDDSKSK